MKQVGLSRTFVLGFSLVNGAVCVFVGTMAMAFWGWCGFNVSPQGLISPAVLVDFVRAKGRVPIDSPGFLIYVIFATGMLLTPLFLRYLVRLVASDLRSRPRARGLRVLVRPAG